MMNSPAFRSGIQHRGVDDFAFAPTRNFAFHFKEQITSFQSYRSFEFVREMLDYYVINHTSY